MADVTDKQRTVLTELWGLREPSTARRIADHLETPQFRSARYTYDEIYAHLRRLERKGLVRSRRGPRAKVWEPTDAGAELAEATREP